MSQLERVYEELVASINLDAPPRDLGIVIEGVLISLGLSQLKASEKAELYEGRIRNRILEEKARCDETGIIPPICINSANPRMFQGGCCIEPSDPPAVQIAKRARLFQPELRDAIRALTSDQFETFGAKVLFEIGASDISVTRRAGDQGIDFHGKLSIGRITNIPPAICQLSHDVTLRFAGQAKHYPDIPVGPSAIRELVGSIELARHKVFTGQENPLAALKLLPCHPIMAVVFTTGRFTAGANELARETGVILRDGDQLAVFLADRNIGVTHGPNGAVYDELRFQDWLAAPLPPPPAPPAPAA